MRHVFFLVLAALLVLGCAQQAQVEKTGEMAGKVEIKDMLGRTVEVPEKVERVVAIVQERSGWLCTSTLPTRLLGWKMQKPTGLK